jgi:hypothetical protein
MSFLTAYAARRHDSALKDLVDAAVAGRSGAAVLVGGSSTGKTRACWQALEYLDRRDRRRLPVPRRRWRVWRPQSAANLLARLSEQKRPMARTVLWLDELQIYLLPDPPELGEQVAGALRSLLEDHEQEPVLVLGTIWPDPDRWGALVREPTPDEEDPHQMARLLLRGRGIRVPETVEGEDAAAVRATASNDPRLAVASQRGGSRIIQFLAGARHLLDRYDNADPAERALLDAAGDARRVGVPHPMSRRFLKRAASDYLSAADRDRFAGHLDWTAALHRLGTPSRGITGPLAPTNDPGEQGYVLLEPASWPHGHADAV